MFRSAAVCFLLAAAILPDLASAAKSDWNDTDLDDEILIGIIAAAGVLFLLIVIIVAVCCCCFVCPDTFGCGPQQIDQPYFEQPPPPPAYYPEPEPMPMMIPPPPQEPVYIVRPEPEPRRERVSYTVRDNYGRDYYDPYDRYDDRRVIIRTSGHGGSRYERERPVYSHRHSGYDDGHRRSRAIMDSPRKSAMISSRNDYY